MIPCGEIKVRGFHIDVFSHVNNARYLEFMEEARWVVLEEYIGFKKKKTKGVIFVVVNININYRKRLRWEIGSSCISAFMRSAAKVRSFIRRSG